MNLEIVLAPFVFGAFASWIVAVVSGLQMLSLRAPGVTIGHLAVRGTAFFDARNFKPEAAPHARRLRLAFAAFFACVVLAAVLAAWLSSRAASGS